MKISLIFTILYSELELWQILSSAGFMKIHLHKLRALNSLDSLEGSRISALVFEKMIGHFCSWERNKC